MNLDPSVAKRTTIVYLRESRELNLRIVGAINAGHRMKLLEEKNRIIEQFEAETGLCDIRPAPAPDLPVFDLRAMDDLITREAELEKLAEIEPPQFTWKSKLGFVVAVSLFLVTVTIVSLQIRDFNADVRPVLTSQEGRRAQVQQILAEVGDRDTIQSITNIEQLEAKLAQTQKAVRALALGGTDEELEDEISKRRETIKKQMEKLINERGRR